MYWRIPLVIAAHFVAFAIGFRVAVMTRETCVPPDPAVIWAVPEEVALGEDFVAYDVTPQTQKYRVILGNHAAVQPVVEGAYYKRKVRLVGYPGWRGAERFFFVVEAK